MSNICKVADSDVETEELAWQAIGRSGVPASTPNRIASPPANSRDTAGRHLSLAADNDVLKQKILEMAAQRGLELEQARQSGLDQGLRQARQEAAAEMESALDRLARTIQDFAQIKRRVRNEAENELVKLSLAIARRILHRELTTDPQSLRGVVYAAMQRLQNRDVTRIRVFPAAVPAVKNALERNGGLAAIEIIGDAMLQPGGLVFETSLGELDASVETQLQEIERGFVDRLQLQ